MILDLLSLQSDKSKITTRWPDGSRISRDPPVEISRDRPVNRPGSAGHEAPVMILDLLSLQSDKSKITRDKHGIATNRGVWLGGCARGTNPEAR